MEKNLIILRGVPGCGKSTVAELLSDGGIICTADDFFIGGNGYEFNPNLLGVAHKHCKDKCENAMVNGEGRIIVANTSTTEKELAPYIKMGKKYGYKIFSLIVENRHGGENVHGVPEDTIDKMVNRFNVKLK